jgi:hypothetical protein
MTSSRATEYAQAIDGIVRDASRPSEPSGQRGAVHHSVVQGSAPLLARVADALRGDGPFDEDALDALGRLLEDGDSPLFGRDPGAFRAEVERLAERLTGSAGRAGGKEVQG